MLLLIIHPYLQTLGMGIEVAGGLDDPWVTVAVPSCPEWSLSG